MVKVPPPHDSGGEDFEEALSKSPLGRFFKMSSALGGSAARWASSKYLGTEIDTLLHAKNLKALLGGLKGPLMKAAQLLSTIPGALPDEYVQELSELQSQAPPMGWPFVRRRMRIELGPDWQSKFKEFSKDAQAAASLGQVHQATSISGEALALKLQYPDMDTVVTSDLSQLKMFLRLYETMNKSIQTDLVFEELKERLMEELDYTREAQHIALYEKIFDGINWVHVPKTFPDLSTKRLLTMSWLEGRPLKEIENLPQERRNCLAERMFTVWYKPLYHYGIVHGDPHLGNYTFTSQDEINLLDFGCIRVFDPQFIQGVLDLYRALQRNDRDALVAAYEGWGFKNLSKDLIDVLNQWAAFLYDPLLEDKVRTIHAHHEGKKGQDIASEIHRKLHEVGGVRPPREFVMMDRAAVGMGAVFMHLNAQCNWHRLFETLIEGYDPVTIKQRQTELGVS